MFLRKPLLGLPWWSGFIAEGAGLIPSWGTKIPHVWPKKKLIKENHYLLSGFRASSRSNGKHGLSRLIQSPLKAYSVIPVTHLSCLPCTHWPNVPRIASSPEFYAHGTSQMLFVSEVTRNCDTQLL